MRLFQDILDLFEGIEPALISHMMVVFITLFLSLFFNRFYIKRVEKIHKEEIARLHKIYANTNKELLKANNMLNDRIYTLMHHANK